MNNITSSITAVAFDYGGVIADFLSVQALEEMARLAAVPREAFRRAYWEHRGGYDSGALQPREYWGAVLEGSGSPWRGDDSRYALLIRGLLHLDAAGWSRINPAILRWILELHRRDVRLLVISNMAGATREMVIDPAPWRELFERVVISGALGVNKPDREIFRHAAQEMALEPQEILFLDDLETNVEGARRAGYAAHQVVSPDDLFRDLRESWPALVEDGR
ncbi:HAD family hydrolase [Alkalispirochaeta alkalica]|uniref:HAD family hydrolase n=1 Tax=Alkalispirochaeta alkalica TaxID=46356 RepID=UPI00035DA3EC|nr:HAD family phosphatase [Alkalispirochaeta alkalica]